jgi:hypothetical protein
MMSRVWSCSAVLLCGLALALGCQSTTAAPPADDGPFGWCLGHWKGVRRDGTDGTIFPMTSKVEPILGGAGQIEQLEVEREGREPYRGVTVQAFDRGAQKWKREYVNEVNGRFVPMEGTLDGSARSEWRDTSSERTHDFVLTSELLSQGFWRRTMRISEDGGKTWKILWIDDLNRVD